MPETLLYALLGGLIPTLIWLWFWLKEDARCPEPKGLILLAFIAGMIAVPLVIPLERWAQGFFTGITLLIVWAFIEEITKFGVAYIAVLRQKAVNEPIDVVIYMITVALGFAALENTFFLLNPLLEGDILGGLLTGNFRFLGATLLHTASSGIIGLFLGFSFYKRKATRKNLFFLSLVLAVALHALFNFFIMNSNGEKTLLVFSGVWILVLALILSFEKIKRITKPRLLR